MSFVVSGLTDYVNEQSQVLIAATQFKSETAALAQIQTGIKSSAALQLLSVSPVPQAGTTCGFTASGTSTFTQRILTTAAIKYEESLCPKALQTKWTQLLLKKGQTYSEADIPAMIIEEIQKNIARINETADWMGDTTSGSAYLSLYDGLVKIIGDSTGKVTATASTFNATNARAIIKNVINNIPAALKNDPAVEIVLGTDSAEIYRQALMDANLYHVPAGSDPNVMYAEGSIYKIRAVHGLDGRYSVSGAACCFALRWDNIFLGCDLENEESSVAKMWVDGSDQETVKYRFAFRRGWQIGTPSEIVQYLNT